MNRKTKKCQHCMKQLAKTYKNKSCAKCITQINNWLAKRKTDKKWKRAAHTKIAFAYKKKTKNIPYDKSISIKEIQEMLDSGDMCSICQRIMTWDTKENKYEMVRTLDRLDNEQGHVRGNLVLMCHGCNVSKAARPITDVPEWIRERRNLLGV